MLNKLKARKSQLQAKGGFTLVELIVVLVILAILAALLIPALTGYIDKAKEKKVISETRMLVMAAQTIASDEYGAGNTTITYAKSGDDKAGDGVVSDKEIAKLVDFTLNDGTDLDIDFNSKNIVSKLTWTNDKKTCNFTLDANGKASYSCTSATSGGSPSGSAGS